MLTYFQDILSADTAALFCQRLLASTAWHDGGRTAAGHARQVKHNQQLLESDPVAGDLLRHVRQALASHPIFTAAARPRQLVRLLVSRYEPGMAYGRHIDAALIEGQRTDLSFTLFLSPPDSYGGGSLNIDLGGSEDSVKLPAGHMVLYPTRYLHEVAPVTSGTRLAVVGWVRSRIRHESQRDLLFDLDQALRDLNAGDTAGASLRLRCVQANLLREWLDD